jgi:hypothetical protein
LSLKGAPPALLLNHAVYCEMIASVMDGAASITGGPPAQSKQHAGRSVAVPVRVVHLSLVASVGIGYGVVHCWAQCDALRLHALPHPGHPGHCPVGHCQCSDGAEPQEAIETEGCPCPPCTAVMQRMVLVQLESLARPRLHAGRSVVLTVGVVHLSSWLPPGLGLRVACCCTCRQVIAPCCTHCVSLGTARCVHPACHSMCMSLGTA